MILEIMGVVPPQKSIHHETCDVRSSNGPKLAVKKLIPRIHGYPWPCFNGVNVGSKELLFILRVFALHHQVNHSFNGL